MTQYLISDLTEETAPDANTFIEAELPDGSPRKINLTNFPLNFLYAGKQNFLANGGFELAQRQDPTVLTDYTSAMASRMYAADRWSLISENAGVSYQRVDTGAPATPLLRAKYYGRVVKTANVGKMGMYQIVEQADAANLTSVSLTGLSAKARVSIWVKKAVASSMTARLTLLHLGNSGVVDSIPAGLITDFGDNGVVPTWGANLTSLGSYTLDLTTIWQEITFSNFSTNQKNLVVVITTDAQAQVGDELLVAQAGLYAGTELVAWQGEPIAQTIQRCQRYYCKTFNLDQAPVANAGLLGALRSSIKIAGAVTTSWAGTEWRFPVRMRAAPQLTFYNPSLAASAFVKNITAGSNATATSAANIGDMSAHINCTGLAAWTVGQDSVVHITADAEL